MAKFTQEKEMIVEGNVDNSFSLLAIIVTKGDAEVSKDKTRAGSWGDGLFW